VPLIWVLNFRTRSRPLGVLSITLRSQQALKPLSISQSPPTRAERGRIFKRLREKPAQEQPDPGKYHSELSQYKEREALKKSFFEISRLALSDGEAVRMMKGHTIKVGELSYWSGTSGCLFQRRRKIPTPLKRFNALVRKRGIQLPD